MADKQLIFIKAAEGRRVRDPRTGHLLPSSGMPVDPANLYWFRRLQDGDVVEVNEDGSAKEQDTLLEKHGVKPRDHRAPRVYGRLATAPEKTQG